MKISVVIATYNSMKTLPKVIKSLKNQTISKKDYEIICVDGGSRDGTLDFIKQENLTLIINPRKEPVYAKYLGFLEARGKYLIYLDHDEEIKNKKSLELKLKGFEENKNLKSLAPTGYIHPKGYHFINNYINEFGDPFSYFIYRISKNKDFYVSSMKRKFKSIRENEDYIIFKIDSKSNLPLIELLAGGSMFDLDYVKEKFPETKKDYTLLTHLFYVITNKTNSFCITKNDPIIHYSSDNFFGYLKKIEWRIKNNIYFKNDLGKSGFSGRESLTNFSYLKFLFIPYSFSILFPLIDSIYLSISRRNFSMLIHLPLTIYTAYLICLHLVLFKLGVESSLTTYDGKTKISN